MQFYAHFDPNNGCYYHRILSPLRYCEQDFPDCDFELSLTDPQRQFDYYLLHGLIPWSNFKYVTRWRKGGGKWIWGTDDALTLCPEWNPAKPTSEEIDTFYHARDYADYILVSTPALAEEINRPQKTFVARNLMEVDLYSVNEPAPRDQGTVRILWAGSKTHDGDVRILEKPIEQLIHKWGNRVEFIFMGFAPGNLLKKYLNRGVSFVPGTSLDLYPKLLRGIRPHICLAPLADIPFNRAKSNIRCLESFALAAALVASPVGEYCVVRDGIDGLHASTECEWFEQMDRLITDEELCRELGREGRRRVGEIGDWANPNCRGEWKLFLNFLKKKLG